MNSIELLKEHPKAATVIKQWILNQLLESLKNDSIPEDFKQQILIDGIDDERIADLIDVSPRGLFDCFDEQKVHIQIGTDCTNVFKTMFAYSFDCGKTNSDLFYTRKEAEKEAVTEAFKILNDKL